MTTVSLELRVSATNGRLSYANQPERTTRNIWSSGQFSYCTARHCRETRRKVSQPEVTPKRESQSDVGIFDYSCIHYCYRQLEYSWSNQPFLTRKDKASQQATRLERLARFSVPASVPRYFGSITILKPNILRVLSDRNRQFWRALFERPVARLP